MSVSELVWIEIELCDYESRISVAEELAGMYGLPITDVRNDSGEIIGMMIADITIYI